MFYRKIYRHHFCCLPFVKRLLPWGMFFQDILYIYSVYDMEGHKLVNWFAWKTSISAFVIFDKIIRYTLIAIQATKPEYSFLSDNRRLNYI